MAAKVKLQRKGTKKRPIYNIVVQDESLATKGMAIDVLGQYNPLAEPSVFDINKEKTLEWIKKGAKPTDRVRILLGKAGVLPPVDLALLHKRKPKAEIKAEAKTEEKQKEEPKKEEAKAEAKEEAKEEVKEAPKS